MATKPSHVAVGDPVTATDRNNVGDWIGTPVQMTAWGSGFIGTPTAGSEIQAMRGWASATTNASGVINITLPAAFPNNVCWFSADTTSSSLFVIRAAATGANASTIVFVCYNASGAVLANTAVNLIWEAMGY